MLRPTIAAIATTTCALHALAQPTFTGIGHLDGYSKSFAAGVSGDGQTVAGTVTTPLSTGAPSHAVRWTRTGGLVSLDHPDFEFWSAASAISHDGLVIVGSTTLAEVKPPPVPTRWLQVAQPEYFMSEGYVHDISDGGDVAVGVIAFQELGFRYLWATGERQYLHGDPRVEQEYTYAYSVSADGQRTVGTSRWFDHGTRAVYWDGTSTDAQVIEPLPSFSSSRATAVSPDGSIIAGSGTDGGNIGHAFLWWESGEALDLGHLPGESAEPTGLSDDGGVVVGTSSASSELRAFIWTSITGMEDLRELLVAQGLDLSGWKLHNARGVSADGRTVVGNGINPQGQAEGWVATLGTPCPADFDTDGFVTGADYDAYVQAFEAGDVSADFDGDGFITGTDFDLYVVAFEKGC